MAKKSARLFTAEESNLVGWEGEVTDDYPDSEMFERVLSGPDRAQMIRWHRFLVEPKTREEIEMVQRLIDRLSETCPGAR